MCGITAAFYPTDHAHVDGGLLKHMNDTQEHRGPDGSGVYVDNGVGLAHRRLSIIDLAGGKQPFFNEDQSVGVTFNGEIYNFQEVNQELKALGYQFKSRSDTETIVHAWSAWGVKCVERFNGMFAFALWDQNKRQLFVARDRLGVKPLFYTELADGSFWMASELKALLAHPQTQRELDPLAVEDYFTFGYVPEPKTIFRDVKKLEPGHYMLLSRNRPPEIVQYWDLDISSPKYTAPCEDVAAQLKDAVQRRLISDVPLGAFLSGGIDSSAVVAMMREISEGELLTCSIGFDESRYDESEYANLVAQQKRTDHKTRTVQTSDFDLIDKLVGLYDEPYADSSAIPTYRVCELARKHVTVALSGDAGDECFLGYRRYKLFAREQMLRDLIPESIRRPIFTPLGKLYPKLDWAPRFVRGKTTFQALARSTSHAYLHGVSICPDEMRSDLFSEGLKRDLQGYRSSEVFDRHLQGKEFADSLRMIQYLDYKTYLVGDILTKVDRASMAHSLEVRGPFLDYQFVEWAAGLPTREKLDGGETKAVLKKAMEPYLPHDVLYRKKMGFAVPLDSWFRGALRERITSVLSSGPLLDSGLFNPDMLARIGRDHISGRRDHAAPLWSLLMFDGFLRASQ